MSPRSLPAACAILFPATKLPTMMDAGPTPTMKDRTGQNTVRKISHPSDFFYLQIWRFSHLQDLHLIPTYTPGCFWRGLGMLVTQVWGHMRMLQGCSAPSRKSCLVSEMWMPPRGVLGRVLAGTSARQYNPTWWILSIAWRRETIHKTTNK